MADEKIYLTEEGYKEKEDRLNELRNVFRPAVVERIKFAKEQGDLSENAEYSAAREEQAKIEGEIAELEETLKRAEIIQKGEKGKVSMGSVVKIYDMEMEDKCFGMIKDVIEEWHCNRVHLPAYYNSGVILFNIKACQQKNIVQQLLDGCLLYPNSKFPDQDIINIVGKEDIVSASFIYNAQILSTSSQSINFFNNNMKEIKILHYVGEQKPWSIKGNPFELFYFQIWIKSLWKKDLHLLMFKRYRRFLFAQVKMDGVKTNYILGIPVMRRQRKGNNKTVWILGMKVLEKKVKIKYIQDEGMH